jgi:hypothetical protein
MRPVTKIPPTYLRELSAENNGNEREAIHHALIESLGNYCSYCEMPLSDYHVEHIRYLAEWPEQLSISQWDELLLICNDCRSHLRVPVLNELSANALLWPDRDLTFSLVNSPLQYELRTVNYVVVNEQERISEEVKDLVFVVANPQSDDFLYQKAYNTIVHFQLNMQLEYYDEATNELRVPLQVHQERSDNRMFKRTTAWMEAQDTVKRLKELERLNEKEGDQLRQLFTEQIAMTAWYSGNWSVWMTVFYQQTKDLELLRTAFAGNIHVFAGLNTDNGDLFRAE